MASACFGNSVYEDNAAGLCFSNLLATGFRRFVLDLFWDDGRRVWSFCPAQVPNSTSNAEASASSTQVFTTTSSVSISNGQISARGLTTQVVDLGASTDSRNNGPTKSLDLRQATSSTPSVSRSASTSSSSAVLSSTGSTSAALSGSSSATSTVPVVVPSNGAFLYQIGPYQCTSTIDLPVFTAVLSGYLRNTSTTLAAIITYLELNLHVSSSLTSPSNPAIALNSSTVPPPKQLITNVLNVNLSSFLYTPSMLQNDRNNLNGSWFSITQGARPYAEYFNVGMNAQNVLTTPDGWPSESYVEFTKAFRLMVEFGTVDPQITGYNFSGDSDTIFPQHAFESSQTVSYNALGFVDQGCFFNNGTTTVAGSNNSWALTTDLQIPPGAISISNSTLPEISNLTACGISPLLNTTLSNTTADRDLTPYQSLAYNSIWSWSSNEPRNVSSTEPNPNLIRCALLDLTLSGRWRVADCTEKHFAACRSFDSPYIWHLSSSRGTYSASGDSCPSDTSFAAPRTGLENTYLSAAIGQELRVSDNDGIDTGFWVDFNSLDAEGCWVVGVNSTCPYTVPNSATRRTVVIPTVAAVIVFVIAALTLFVKCAANRQNSRRGRRRRRAADGWDYEGVPS